MGISPFIDFNPHYSAADTKTAYHYIENERKNQFHAGIS